MRAMAEIEMGVLVFIVAASALVVLIWFVCLDRWSLFKMAQEFGFMAFWVLAVSLVGLSLTGCSTALRPSECQTDCASVALVDHGRHSSLIISESDKKMSRYAYGDWQYFAKADTRIWSGAKALLWPTQATLARRHLLGPVTHENIHNQLIEGVEEMWVFQVPSRRARVLKSRLDFWFSHDTGTLFYNKFYDLDFVHHPSSYWLFNNSNQVMGRWLKDLGFEVSGLSLWSKWRISSKQRTSKD